MSDSTEWFEGKRLEKLHERCFWRRVGFGAWAIFLIFLLLMLASCATVEKRESPYDGPNMVAKGPTGDSVRLTKAPCLLTSGWLKFATAEMHWRGKTYKACWVKVGQTVLVFDDNGDVTPIPAQMFQPEVDA